MSVSKVQDHGVKVGPLFVGVGATLAVVGVAIWMAVLPVCGFAMDGAQVCQSKWASFLAAPPNEVGDTLAGFAGVLAFIWIIVTVWLQSQELSEQRQELVSQREEMEGQRKASEEMARAMQAQADYFKNESERGNKIAAWRIVEELLATFRRRFPIGGSYHPIQWAFEGGGEKRFLTYVKHGTDARALLDDEFMSQVLGAAQKHCRAPVMKAAKAGLAMTRSGDKLLDELHSLIRKMREQECNLEEDRRMFLGRCRLKDWDDLLADLKSAGNGKVSQP